MYKYVKKVLMYSTAILMTASVFANFQSPVNARRIIRYHYRTHRTHRRRPRVKPRNKRVNKIRKVHNRKRVIKKRINRKNTYRNVKKVNQKRHQLRKRVNGRRPRVRRFKKRQRQHLTSVDKDINNALRYMPHNVAKLPLTEKQISHIKNVIDYGGNITLNNEKAGLAFNILDDTEDNQPVNPKQVASVTMNDYKGEKPTAVNGYFCAAMINSPKDRFIGGTSATDPRTHTPEQVKANMENEIKNVTISDLNQDRASIGESPLEVCWDLNDTAKSRSQDLVTDFSHQNANGEYASDEDGNIDSENIAYETEPYGSNNDDISEKAAHDLNKMLFYDEERYDGGHYQDIRDHNQVGVGATIANGNVYLAEDFAE